MKLLIKYKYTVRYIAIVVTLIFGFQMWHYFIKGIGS